MNPRSPTSVSLVVLPFENLSAHAEQDYFSRGFVDDLIADLSRFPNVRIIASHTAEALGVNAGRGELVDSLHIDFLLKGTLRRDSETLRINAQLVHPADGRVFWAERIDAPIDHVFEIQDAITSRVVGALSRSIDASMLTAARRKPLTELAAYDCWLRGGDHLKQGTLAADEKARELFRAALDIDPAYARAYVGLSLSHFNEWSCQLWERWDDNESRAFEYAKRANELDEGDHVAQMVLGRILLFRREFDLAEQHLDRAIALNPNDADCLVQISMSKAFLGQSEEALELFEKAIELNPYHDSWYNAYGMLACCMACHYEEAIALALKTPLEIMVDFPAHLAAAYAHTGDVETARGYIPKFVAAFSEKIAFGRSADPEEALRWALHVNPYKRPEDEERFVEGLRLAGLEASGDQAPAADAPAVAAGANVFRRVGDVWQLAFDGQAVYLTEVKGFHDLVVLLERPGSEVHCVQLIGAPAEGGGSEVIDTQARQEYESRIRDLQASLAEAESMNDLGRAERLQEELDQVVSHLQRALGLGGRSRKLGAPSERARSAVTWRIRSAIRKIEASHSALGRHLTKSVLTGSYCSYTPESAPVWEL